MVRGVMERTGTKRRGCERAGRTFSLIPPTGVTAPVRVISPVIPIPGMVGMPSTAEGETVSIAPRGTGRGRGRTKRDKRDCHRHARRRSVLLDRSRRKMNMQVNRLERVLERSVRDTQLVRVRLDPRESDVRRLLDDFSKLAGRFQTAGAGEVRRLDLCTWSKASVLNRKEKEGKGRAYEGFLPDRSPCTPTPSQLPPSSRPSPPRPDRTCSSPRSSRRPPPSPQPCTSAQRHPPLSPQRTRPLSPAQPSRDGGRGSGRQLLACSG